MLITIMSRRSRQLALKECGNIIEKISETNEKQKENVTHARKKLKIVIKQLKFVKMKF